MNQPNKVKAQRSGPVLTVTLADDAKRNALSHQLSTELIEAFDGAEADEGIRVVVVTNEGRTFCAGADLSERSGDRPASPVDPAEIFGRIRRSRKPYVGRIAGHAVAGGMGLAAAMDISVAVEDATFGFTEVRVGVAPAIISVICLPKMRQADAAAAFLRGNRFPAAEAVGLGLINEAVGADTLDQRIDAIVADLLEGGPEALAAAKRLLSAVPSMPFDRALRWAAEVSADLFESAEGQEGMTAYLQRRPPSWSPRAER